MRRFSDSNGRAARRDFEGFFLDRPLRPFPKTFDRRSARIRAMLLVQIAQEKLVDPITGKSIDGSALLADPDLRDLPYVFRPEYEHKPSRDLPANPLVINPPHGYVKVTEVITLHLMMTLEP